MNPITLIKFVGCWVCIVAAIIDIAVGHQYAGGPGVLALLAIAFATAPATW